MTNQAERISYLIHAYLDQTITAEEKDELDHFINSSEANAAYFREITNKEHFEILLTEFGEADGKKIWQQIRDAVPALNEEQEEKQTVAFHKKTWWRYAAAAVLLLSLGGWWYMGNHSRVQPADSSIASQDVAPGGNRASLQLADGTVILLDSAGDGKLATEGNTVLTKKNDELLYTTTNGDLDAVAYNTISTPRGGTFRLTLSDGSRVWLNAGSSLRYPAKFDGLSRKVELKGEGYFEIAPQYAPPVAGDGNIGRKKLPFLVAIQTPDGEQQGIVEVLGTHFNVNAYNKTAIETTLTEGIVQVSSVHSRTAVLRPGQQARIAGSSNDLITVTSDIDTEDVLAWKDGFFSFSNASLRTVMEQVSLWYNVDIDFDNGNTASDTSRQPWNNHYSFKLNRDLPLSQLLKVLEMTGTIHFAINNNKIIIR